MVDSELNVFFLLLQTKMSFFEILHVKHLFPKIYLGTLLFFFSISASSGMKPKAYCCGNSKYGGFP